MSGLKTIQLGLLRFVGALALMVPLVAAAELVVVVDSDSCVKQLSKTQVINIFLGHHRVLPCGKRARPVDLLTAKNEKPRFYRLLVNREPDQMAAYWARLVFAGSTPPPMQAASARQVIRFVENNRGGIGYMDRQQVSGRVVIVFSFE